jgi:hypothetical protein
VPQFLHEFFEVLLPESFEEHETGGPQALEKTLHALTQLDCAQHESAVELGPGNSELALTPLDVIERQEGRRLMTASRSDALVPFGVTGDLAHKMIFAALYAMPKRGALKAPVIGGAAPFCPGEK